MGLYYNVVFSSLWWGRDTVVGFPFEDYSGIDLILRRGREGRVWVFCALLFVDTLLVLGEVLLFIGGCRPTAEGPIILFLFNVLPKPLFEASAQWHQNNPSALLSEQLDCFKDMSLLIWTFSRPFSSK